MRVTQIESKVKPHYKVADSLNLNGSNLLDLKTLKTNILVNLLEDNMKKRDQPLSLKLIK